MGEASRLVAYETDEDEDDDDDELSRDVGPDDFETICVVAASCIYFKRPQPDYEQVNREVLEQEGCASGHVLSDSEEENAELRALYTLWRHKRMAMKGEELKGHLCEDGAWFKSYLGFLPVAQGGGAGVTWYLPRYQIICVTQKNNIRGIRCGPLLQGGRITEEEMPYANEEYEDFLDRRTVHRGTRRSLYHVLGYVRGTGRGWKESESLFGEVVPGWWTDGQEFFPMSWPRKLCGVPICFCGIKAIERETVLEPIVNIEGEFLEMSFSKVPWLLVFYFVFPYAFLMVAVPIAANHLADGVSASFITASFGLLCVLLGISEILFIHWRVPNGTEWMFKKLTIVARSIGLGIAARFDIYTDATFLVLAYTMNSPVWPYAIVIFSIGVGLQFFIGLTLNLKALMDCHLTSNEIARVADFNECQMLVAMTESLWKGQSEAKTSAFWTRNHRMLQLFGEDVPQLLLQIWFSVDEYAKNGNSNALFFTIGSMLCSVIASAGRTFSAQNDAKKLLHDSHDTSDESAES